MSTTADNANRVVEVRLAMVEVGGWDAVRTFAMASSGLAPGSKSLVGCQAGVAGCKVHRCTVLLRSGGAAPALFSCSFLLARPLIRPPGPVTQQMQVAAQPGSAYAQYSTSAPMVPRTSKDGRMQVQTPRPVSLCEGTKQRVHYLPAMGLATTRSRPSIHPSYYT